MDADEQESESVEGTGEGAQWTVFFGAGVAAMRAELYEPQQRRACRIQPHTHITWSRQYPSTIIESIYYQINIQ